MTGSPPIHRAPAASLLCCALVAVLLLPAACGGETTYEITDIRRKPPPSRLTWTAPVGWEPRPARPMREVTFAPRSSEHTECYVSILGGTAGGLARNLDRWRAQLDREPFDEEEIAALPRIEVMGGKGVLVEIEGDFQGQGGKQVRGAALLGFILERENKSIFVKMTGPAVEVLPQRENFEAFCRSLGE